MSTPLRFTSLFTASVIVAAGCGGGETSTTGAAGSAGSAGTGASAGSSGSSAGGSSAGAAGGTTGGAGGTSATGGSAGTAGAGACTGYQGQATAAEIAKSPFANAEAEVLAVEASGKLVAPEHVYQRIVTDLAAIRSQNAAVQGINAMASWAPDELLMGFDDAGLAAVKAGTYTDWDCANALYGLVGKDVGQSFVTLHFSHKFNAPLLGAEYAAFSNVEYAEPNGFAGDGNDVCVSMEGDTTTYNYIFDAGSGDCPAGCISHMYWGFTTKTAGMPAALGTYDNAQGNPPAWYLALSECTKWL